MIRKNTAEFLRTCSEDTFNIHFPILDLDSVGGRLNPSQLDWPKSLKNRLLNSTSLDGQLFGQSTRGFISLNEYLKLDDGPSLGRWEYGVVATDKSVELAERINELYHGQGAVTVSSGMAAINATVGTVHHYLRDVHDKIFAEDCAILVPQHVYYPFTRLIGNRTYFSPEQVIHYGPTEENFEAVVAKAISNKKLIGMIYIESPVSNYFDAHDLGLLTKRANELGALTVIDNTFSTYLGCQPIKNYGVDIIIDAGTKYLGGYADCPYGAVICKDPSMAERVSSFVRAHGLGTMAPGLAVLAIHRLESADERMRASYETARKLREEVFAPMLDRGVVSEVRVYDPSAIGSPRLAEQYRRGNGLFTAVFNTAKERNAFVNNTPLLIAGASWGGHVTLATEPTIHGKPGARFYAGLEAPEDLKRAFERGRKLTFGF